MTDAQAYDLLVVGAGIAGLATAELSARSGKRVALLERNDNVCTEASGAHHGWFHFGSLYSIFPYNHFMRTLVGGVDDLLEYYSAFPGVNLGVDDHGRLQFRNDSTGWIRDEPIQYLVAARNDPDFDLRRFDGISNYLRKLLFTLGWEYNIKQFISRHQRFHKFDWRSGPASLHVPRAGWLDYSREVIHKPKDIGCVVDRDTHFTIFGFDRPMNPTAIATDLLNAFISSGGTLVRQCVFRQYRRRGSKLFEVATSAGTFHARRLAFAVGRWFKEFRPEVRTHVVASPLLIAYPAVCDISWARLTPFTDRTINHLKHYALGEPYSLIGGGYFAEPNDSNAVERAKTNLLRSAERIFPRLHRSALKQIYVGYKTEVITKPGERNYQYFIRQTDDDVFALIPGKYSLAFSLAVNAYKRIFGSTPSRVLPKLKSNNVENAIEPPLHERAVLSYLKSNQNEGYIAAEAGIRTEVRSRSEEVPLARAQRL